MYWLRGWQLPEAYEALTGKRRCSPRVEAIRAATADLLTDSRPCQLTVGIRRRGTAQTFQVGMRTQQTPCRTGMHATMFMRMAGRLLGASTYWMLLLPVKSPSVATA